jgi:predicted metal-dependent phosphoesterase TrpH
MGKTYYACSKQVRVLALTDHDTMSGIPEAVEAASAFGMRIIPGVEISALFSPRYQLNKYSIS